MKRAILIGTAAFGLVASPGIRANDAQDDGDGRS